MVVHGTSFQRCRLSGMTHPIWSATTLRFFNLFPRIASKIGLKLKGTPSGPLPRNLARRDFSGSVSFFHPRRESPDTRMAPLTRTVALVGQPGAFAETAAFRPSEINSALAQHAESWVAGPTPEVVAKALESHHRARRRSKTAD